MHTLSVAELSKSLKNKEFSSVELTQHYLDRINRSDLNAFITVTDELALSQARTADAKLANGSGSVLTGIPFASKDIFCTKGVKTSAGSKILDPFISPYDATLSHKLNIENMVMLGKTNMDEFAMGSSNENSFYGPVKNPWNKKMVPGGSSGGSAAAVAGRLSPFATGTDTGGSIRQPSSLCGITGIKPTYGRVSRYGMIAYASSLDQAGPMTQTAEDAALVLNAIAGFDEKDSTSALRDVPDYTKSLKDSIKGLKIGIPKEYRVDNMPNEIDILWKKGVDYLKDAGAIIKNISLPHTKYALPAYYIVAPAEASSNLARYDGVKYGHRSKGNNLFEMYENTRSEGFGDEVKRRILIGTYVLSSGYYDAYYLKAQKIRKLIKKDFDKVFNDIDAILTPSTPSAAFKIGDKKDDPVSMYLNDIFTVPVNLAGLPAISVPAGYDKNNLPLGLQLIGKPFDEQTILNLSLAIEKRANFKRKIKAWWN